MSDPTSISGSSGLACVCGRPLAIGIQDLCRLVAGERIGCPACGSDFGIDMDAGKQGVEALNRFCEGVGGSPELSKVFESQPPEAHTAGSLVPPGDTSGLNGVVPHRPGPRYAVKKPGESMVDQGSGSGPQGMYGRHSRSSGRD